MSDTKNHPLFPIFEAAIKQAMYGKGVRHGGAVTPFLEQPWKHYGKLHGRGFLTGQAAKKLEEAASQRNGEAFETEVFGAMVYLGMAVLHEREASAARSNSTVQTTQVAGQRRQPTLADLAREGVAHQTPPADSYLPSDHFRTTHIVGNGGLADAVRSGA